MSNPTPALALGIIIAYAATAALSVANAEPPASPTATTASAEVVEEKAAVVEEEEFQAPSGYEKRLRKGQEVYCRSTAPAGSRIKQTECFTEAQLAAIEEAQRAYRDDMRRQSLICAGAVRRC